MTSEDLFKFHQYFTARMLEICRAKNADYTGDHGREPFANFTRVEVLGVSTTEQGFLARMCDKLSRLASILNSGNVAVRDESVEDTLMDLANYSVLLAAYLEEKEWRNTQKGASNRIKVDAWLHGADFVGVDASAVPLGDLVG